MNVDLFDRLLYRAEGDALHFKADQYSISGATDEEKGEFIRDILAFANSWRDTDAFILIGVKEVNGRKAVVEGITKPHLDDDSLQQLVNAKVQKRVRFNYSGIEIEGKQCGVLQIGIQERPFFLTEKFGKLKPDVVYVRRGNSTTEAKPDEVADMGRSVRMSLESALKFKAKIFLEKTQTEFELKILIWLENSGPLSLKGLKARLSCSGENRAVMISNDWTHFQAGDMVRSMAKNDLNPDEKFDFFYHIAGWVPSANADRYDGPPLEFKVELSAEHTRPLKYILRFEQEDIRQLRSKSFAPESSRIESGLQVLNLS